MFIDKLPIYYSSLIRDLTIYICMCVFIYADPSSDLSVVPTTSDSTHPQLVSSSSSSRNACTSESPQEGPGPSSSCSAAAPDSTQAAQSHDGVPGPNITATEGKLEMLLSNNWHWHWLVICLYQFLIICLYPSIRWQRKKLVWWE